MILVVDGSVKIQATLKNVYNTLIIINNEAAPMSYSKFDLEIIQLSMET